MVPRNGGQRLGSAPRRRWAPIRLFAEVRIRDRERADDETDDIVGGHHGPDPVGGKRGSTGGEQDRHQRSRHFEGTNGADNLLGRGGNDDLFGLGGRDNLLGEEGKDWVLGGNERRPLGGDKNLVGGPGNDGVLGGEGSDNLLGGSGDDFANGGSGPDKVLGGDGNDLLLDGERRGGARDIVTGGDGNDVLDPINRPAGKDLITCGSGFDRVLADRLDVVAPDCERVAVGLAAVLALDQQIEESGFYDRLFEGLAPFPEG
jgi:Ca2+-binding RTX toxin-like protein